MLFFSIYFLLYIFCCNIIFKEIKFLSREIHRIYLPCSLLTLTQSPFEFFYSTSNHLFVASRQSQLRFEEMSGLGLQGYLLRERTSLTGHELRWKPEREKEASRRQTSVKERLSRLAGHLSGPLASCALARGN